VGWKLIEWETFPSSEETSPLGILAPMHRREMAGSCSSLVETGTLPLHIITGCPSLGRRYLDKTSMIHRDSKREE